MEIKTRIYISFAHFTPKKYRAHVKQLLVYAGEDEKTETWLGKKTMLSLLVVIATILFPFALYGRFLRIYYIYAFLLFFGIQAISYLFLYFKVEDRTRRAEDALPDALHLMAANLRAGLTPFQALKMSARKEFGPLREEIHRASAKALGTDSFTDALLNMSKRIRSGLLHRTMKLFTTSLHSGGKLAQLLEELADEITETKALKRQLVTSTKTYGLFIMFVVVVGAPLLLAIAIQFIQIITHMQAKAGVTTDTFGMSFLAGEITLTADFMTKISIVLLIVTGILSSILSGVIEEGNVKFGLRYAPLVVAGSLGMFFLFRFGLGSVVGGMF